MSKVIIQECNSYLVDEVMLKINDGIERIGGWDKFVKRGNTVLLKINLIGPKSSDSAAVTHNEFVRALTRILKNRGCTVWIGDSSGGAIAGIAPTAQSFKVAGYEKVAHEEGSIIKNFDREGVKEVEPKGKFNEKMYLAKPLFDADVVINLPKLKTHSATIYTGAIKNVFGCVPGLRKAMYHKIAPEKEDFGEILADIHEGAKFNLHIMDGIISMQGDGPTAGTVYNANKILISEDPLALDTVAINMLGMTVGDIPILDASKKRNSNAVVKVIDFFKTKPVINKKKCKECNMCVESCPIHAIDIKTKKIDYDTCIECMCCHELCLHKAVEVLFCSVIFLI